MATKMRMRALASALFLPERANRGAPGERLAAVTIWQVSPRADYLKWLAERLAVEQPFIGYHAAVALLVAVRILDQSHREALQKAIRAPKNSLGDELRRIDRWTVLENAARELAEKS